MRTIQNSFKKHNNAVRTAAFAVALILILSCCFALTGTIFANASEDTDATQEAEITPTPDPDATPIPTYNGDKILFEPGEGGSDNTSSPGTVIMIIIVVLAILSIVSGIVEKIVKYYKNRDKDFKVD